MVKLKPPVLDSTIDVFRAYILPVAQTLAFAVPAPWGVVLAGGIQLMTEIFGGSGPDPVGAIANLLEQTVAMIKEMMDQQTIYSAVNSVTTFISWVNVKASVLNQIGSSGETYIVSEKYY
jgi:hypothetical protein